jgi:adenosylcobyric acid synthase
MTALMVQGATSWAGKSLLVTGLARLLRRRGIDVVPFKAMNMSNNARVVTGGEIGAAQYLQGLAAGVEPAVRMNPILIKPEGSNQSQVVVLGKADEELSRLGWRARAPFLWPPIEQSLRSLLAEHELVLIEGAGSPAEINLRDTDLANMRTAREADAPVVLIADIDRGGAFAHLYGTWALLPQNERRLVRGFVLNKFRGARSLLHPGPERLERLTGVPVLGVLPWLEHGLPDEDGAAIGTHAPDAPTVAVVRYPTASNLDEFKPLDSLEALRWVQSPSELEPADLVVLPGSKHVAADLDWLRRAGLGQALRRRAEAGRPVLGICGGLQMLGVRIHDEAGVDGSAEGLGLLDIETVFAADKQTKRTNARFCSLAEPWAALSGREIVGYEIRHGRTVALGDAGDALPDGLGFSRGAVLGIYLHGLFEQPALVRALLGLEPKDSLEQTFELLADAVEAHLEIDRLLPTPEVV